MINRHNRVTTGWVFLLVLLGAATASAASFDFETYVATPTGTPLTGQDGWFRPIATESVDYEVHTYAGNSHGFALNPDGGDNFAAGVGPGWPIFPRAEHAITLSGGGLWTIGFDFAALLLPGVQASDYIGSLSMRNAVGDAGTYHALQLLSWEDTSGSTYRGTYLHHDAAGAKISPPGELAGSAWTGLVPGQWYRSTMTIDLTANQVVQVSITDLTTLASSTYGPTDWYLSGGTVGTGSPVALRMFTGGAGPGNVMAFDNLTIRSEIPEASTCLLVGLGALALGVAARRRRRA